ncbi:MAG: hypothetical protein Fur006_18930 [Coleofasciculaceae cyanobacterium]
MLNIFSQHLGLSTAELETLLSFSLPKFLNLPAVKDLLESLDTQLLQETLPTAGRVLAEQLPAFYDWLKNELDVKRVPDSPNHTTKWVIGFLNHQESLTRLVELHRPVPRPALERSIPRLVAMFDAVEEDKVRKAWQKAIAALCLVLVVAARNEKPFVQSAA